MIFHNLDSMRSCIKELFLWATMSFLIQHVQAREFTYTLFDTRDGLPSATITALVEDHAGHLWVGTDVGLVRFNGYHFQDFYADSTYHIGKVNALAVDAQGAIWIGTNTGLTKYDKGQFYPVELGGLDTISIQRLLVRKNNDIILATIRDLFVLKREKGGSMKFDQLPLGGILSLTEGESDDVLVGTVNELKKYSDGEIFDLIDHKRIADEGVIDVFAQGGKLLVGTEDDNIFRYDINTDQLQLIRPYAGSYDDFVSFGDWGDGIWFIYSWTVMLPTDTGEFFIYFPESWNIKFINTSLIDSNGNLWLGSTEGLIRIKRSSFISIDHPQISYEIYSLMEDANHDIWLGSNHGEVYRWNDSGLFEWDGPPDFGGEVIDMIEEPEGNIWLASYWQGLVYIDGNESKRIHESEISEMSPDIYDLHLDRDGHLWIGTYRGVFIKRAGSDQFISGDTLGIPYHCDVYEIKDGPSGVWIAASCGLFHLEEGHFRHVSLPALSSEVQIRSLLVDNEFIWVGTVGFGLRCYAFKDHQMELIQVIDDPDRTILDIVKGQGCIWAGTPRVLLKVVPTSNFDYEIFTSTDGFFEEGYAYLNLLVDHNNSLYITTSRGLKVLKSDHRDQTLTRNLIINEVLVDGQEINLSLPEINLSHSTKIIEFSYYYPDLTNTEFISYQWRMSDELGWTDWNKDRKISLYNPKSGGYQLELRAKKANHLLHQATFSFFIGYPWYQKGWIQFIVVLLAGIIVYYYLKRRDAAIRMEQELETQRALTMASLESRALRAQMNPHFLFNILNNLQEMILTGESHLAQTYLTKFSRLMRMILNISAREYIRIEDEIDFLNLYLDLEQLRFDQQLEINLEVDQELLTEQIPVFMIQPLVENAIRHGLRPLEGKKILQIIIDQEGSFVQVRVKDNGMGFRTKSKLKVVNQDQDVRALDLIRQRLSILAQKTGLECKLLMQMLQDGGIESRLLLPIRI